jgi:hypothetical protein
MTGFTVGSAIFGAANAVAQANEVIIKGGFGNLIPRT